MNSGIKGLIPLYIWKEGYKKVILGSYKSYWEGNELFWNIGVKTFRQEMRQQDCSVIVLLYSSPISLIIIKELEWNYIVNLLRITG